MKIMYVFLKYKFTFGNLLLGVIFSYWLLLMIEYVLIHLLLLVTSLKQLLIILDSYGDINCGNISCLGTEKCISNI